MGAELVRMRQSANSASPVTAAPRRSDRSLSVIAPQHSRNGRIDVRWQRRRARWPQTGVPALPLLRRRPGLRICSRQHQPRRPADRPGPVRLADPGRRRPRCDTQNALLRLGVDDRLLPLHQTPPAVLSTTPRSEMRAERHHVEIHRPSHPYIIARVYESPALSWARLLQAPACGGRRPCSRGRAYSARDVGS